MDVPFLGNLVLCIILVSSAYTLATALAAARGRPHMLVAARYGTYATAAWVALGVLLLAYAFQTHDFRIRYVARYSDRSMEWWYLLTSLWGGQDGSLLWWVFLLTIYTTACTRWMRGKLSALQPWVLATLQSIHIFFLLVMLFAANPFATQVGAAPPDGEGLNPLLQNYWMTIHPPTLYAGFVGWSVPFAFAVAALATGRLHDEWTQAARKWTLIAWLFLSVGLVLGMIWSYEELGWGGYWAWDPVENASFMPWLVGTAYLHSVLVQERYQMLKVWNVFLILLTFIMTIFGTFLTRSGLIASVHSFARSDIGIYFVYYLVFLVIGSFALLVWRLPALKAQNKIESYASREFAFLLNNWILLGMMVFVLVATTFPLISEWMRGEQVTVGPPFYNKWMVPLGLILLCLLGIGPLISWRKATGKNLARAFRIPVAVGLGMGALHLTLGAMAGFPAVIEAESIYETATGEVLRALFAVSPLLSSSLSAFVLATVAQEFWRGTAVRMRKGEGIFVALANLVGRAKRRYGGYIVHVGIVFMFLGYTGAAYDIEKEAALRPGEVLSIGNYKLRYEQPRMESDPNKRMVFTDVTVMDEDGEVLTVATPAKFIYRTHPEMPTTEVSIRSNPIEDLYLIMSTVDPESKRATFRAVVRPLVMWIWFGALILIIGTVIAMFPSVKDFLGERSLKGSSPGSAAGAALFLLAMSSLFGIFGFPAQALAQSDSSSSLHAGTVVLHDHDERRLFELLLCQCGDCARLPLDSCICGWAENKRAELRSQMAAGSTVGELIRTYRAQYGPKSISVPSDKGLDRALWAVPVAGIALAAVGVVFIGRRWKRGSGASKPVAGSALSGETPPGNSSSSSPTSSSSTLAESSSARLDAEYDRRLEEELERLEEG